MGIEGFEADNAASDITEFTSKHSTELENRKMDVVISMKPTKYSSKAFDYIENMGNTYGVYRIQLYKDDQLIYSFVADRFKHSERRYTNSLTDFRAWMTQRSLIQQSFVEPGNHLRMIDKGIGDGTFVIDEERLYHFRYVLGDAHGNESVIEFNIKGLFKILRNH